ncbi:MAG: hypothetical protein AAGA76_15540, partial [Pseudomonadota bacterium]
MKLNTEDHAERVQHQESGGEILRKKSGLSLVHVTRVFFAILVCLAIICVGLLGLVYFLLQGKTGQNSAINTQLEAGLEALVGEAFDVQLNEGALDFSNIGHVNFQSENIRIVRREDGEPLATIGKFEVSTRLLDIISGETNFDFARIDEAWLDADLLGSGQAVFLPAHLDKPLDVTGQTLARLHRNFSAKGFESLEIYNSTISGAILGRKQVDPVTVDRLSILPKDEKSFTIVGLLRTELSDIEYSSEYSAAVDGVSAQYRFDATGIDLREWLNEPTSDEGFVGSDSIIRAVGRMPFDKDGNALDPSLQINASNSLLRIGLFSTTDIKLASLNFRLLLDKNQIELDPSDIEVGRLKASVLGGIKPGEENIGYFGPLRYDLIMSRGEFEPTIEGEPVSPAAMKIAGIYDGEQKKIDISRFVLTTKKGSIIGDGTIGLEGETPSIKAMAKTDGISVAALKQFWPFFVAHGARKWMHEHIVDG